MRRQHMDEEEKEINERTMKSAVANVHADDNNPFLRFRLNEFFICQNERKVSMMM
jgi:hypothetical protein